MRSSLTLTVLGAVVGASFSYILYLAGIPEWPSALGGILGAFLVYRPLQSYLLPALILAVALPVGGWAGNCYPHKYSLEEIDALRSKVLMQTISSTRTYSTGELDAQVEDRLRTLMCNGTRLKEFTVRPTAKSTGK